MKVDARLPSSVSANPLNGNSTEGPEINESAIRFGKFVKDLELRSLLEFSLSAQ